MNEYKVLIRKSVFAKIKEIADYVETVSNKEHAQQYADELEKSLYILSNPIIVNAMQVSQWQIAKKYHLRAKRLITKNRKWNIIFHIEGVYVVVDAIIPSSLMK